MVRILSTKEDQSCTTTRSRADDSRRAGSSDQPSSPKFSQTTIPTCCRRSLSCCPWRIPLARRRTKSGRTPASPTCRVRSRSLADSAAQKARNGNSCSINTTTRSTTRKTRSRRATKRSERSRVDKPAGTSCITHSRPALFSSSRTWLTSPLQKGGTWVSSRSRRPRAYQTRRTPQIDNFH